MRRLLFILFTLIILGLVIWYWYIHIIVKAPSSMIIVDSWSDVASWYLDNTGTHTQEVVNTNYVDNTDSWTNDSINTLNLLNNSKQYAQSVQLNTKNLGTNMGRWDIYARASGTTVQITNDSWENKSWDLWENIDSIYILDDNADYIYARWIKSNRWYIIDIQNSKITNYPWIRPLFSTNNRYVLTSTISGDQYKWLYILSGDKITQISDFIRHNIYIDPNDDYILLSSNDIKMQLYEFGYIVNSWESNYISNINKSSTWSVVDGIVSDNNNVYIKFVEWSSSYISRYDKTWKLLEKVQL